MDNDSCGNCINVAYKLWGRFINVSIILLLGNDYKLLPKTATLKKRCLRCARQNVPYSYSLGYVYEYCAQRVRKNVLLDNRQRSYRRRPEKRPLFF
jgi:hypothetical protein